MLSIYNNVGLDQSSIRGTMDVTDMVGVTTPVGYYKCYQREGVDYDPMTADPKHLTSDAYVLSLQSYVTLDAKRMRYIHPTSEEQIKTANYRVLGRGNAGLSNFSTGVNGTTYPLSVVRGNQNYSYDVTRIVKTNTRADVYFNYDPVTATSDKHLIEYVPVLSVQYSESYYYFDISRLIAIVYIMNRVGVAVEIYHGIQIRIRQRIVSPFVSTMLLIGCSPRLKKR